MVTVDQVALYYESMPEGEEKALFFYYFKKNQTKINNLKRLLYLMPYFSAVKRALVSEKTVEGLIYEITQEFDPPDFAAHPIGAILTLIADILLLPFDIVFSYSLAKHELEYLPETGWDTCDRLGDRSMVAAILGCYLRGK